MELVSVNGQAVALGIAIFCLGWLLLTNAFEYVHVFDAVEAGMPWFYKLSGLWSGQAGSLMFWSFVLSAFIAYSSWVTNKRIDNDFACISALILTVGLVFFLVPVVFISNPFDKLWQLADGTVYEAIFPTAGSRLIVPVDGLGMNPSLRHPAMLLHPPTLYMGLVGLFIPFAYAFASLLKKDRDFIWIKLVYPITIFSWIALTAGMYLGSWWAYTILGWGGYWGWDAVEIAGLLPWMLSFGLIHSMQMQIKGRNFLKWIYILSGGIVFFILAGVLITRSGILESVHAYSVGVMGPVLSILIIINIIPYIYFLLKNRVFRAENNKSGLIAEKLARLFNILIISLVIFYFIGQTFPLTSRLFSNVDIIWTQEIYELLSSPLLLGVLVITGLFPLIDEKKRRIIGNQILFWGLIFGSTLLPVYLLLNTSTSVYGAIGFLVSAFLILAWISKGWVLIRTKRSIVQKSIIIGMILVHIGVGFTAIGILGSENLFSQNEIIVNSEEQTEIDGLVFQEQKREQEISESRTEIYTLEISMVDQDSELIVLKPDLEYYPKMNLLYARPAIDTGLIRDVQVVISEWENPSGSGAVLRITEQPLISWIWIGGVVMILGGIILLFTGRKKSTA